RLNGRMTKTATIARRASHHRVSTLVHTGRFTIGSRLDPRPHTHVPVVSTAHAAPKASGCATPNHAGTQKTRADSAQPVSAPATQPIGCRRPKMRHPIGRPGAHASRYRTAYNRIPIIPAKRVT